LHGISFALAFLAISFVHVVIGEVVPKNLAIEKADRLALLMAPALLVFLRISAPFVFVVERSAAVLSHALGLRGGHTGGGHSPEELKFIVESSRREGKFRRGRHPQAARAQGSQHA
jgi:CBS domain containing-hemolysin-like protein